MTRRADPDQERRARLYYDDFSTTYDRPRGEGYHALIDRLESGPVIEAARGKRVLEIGCGTGLILERIARAGAERAIGIDLSPSMLAHASRRGLQVVRASATALPFEDASFDVVCSFKVLAHVPEIELALAEAVRVTRPGGHLFLELYNRWSLRWLARLAAGSRRIGAGHQESDIPTRWDSPPEIERMLPVGCRLVRWHGVRVLTPAAALHRVPGVASGLAWAEEKAAGSPLGRFGGFLIAVIRRG